ncbi:hypothetical protein BGZ79_002892 [Entomortierella chlamydospora]|nr:hypothetical protein BGZ79_002892 [Entomortierella chlamydospora]
MSSTLLDPSLSTANSQNQLNDYGTVTNLHHQARLLSPEHGNLTTAVQEPSGAGTGSGSLTAATSRRSVIIAVPEQDSDNVSVSSRSSYSSYSSSSSSTHSLLFPCDQDDHLDSGHCDQELSARQLFWTYVALSPILISIWAIFAALLLLLTPVDNDSTIRWDWFGAGMFGWMTAFASRTPIYTLFERVLLMDRVQCEWSTLLSAGALEEVIRLGIISVLGIGGDFGAVYWLGLGWAGVETLCYIGQSLFYSLWLSEDDYRAVITLSSSTPATTGQTANYGTVENNTKDSEEDLSDMRDEVVPPREVRHLLGIDRPWWSLMGRTSSMMVHIGLCCWLGYYGWKLLIPAILTHGALYIVWGALMPEQHWSVPATSYGTLIAAMGIFLIGLALYGEIV